MRETDTPKKWDTCCKGHGNTEEETLCFALDKFHGGRDIHVGFWRMIVFFLGRRAFQSKGTECRKSLP